MDGSNERDALEGSGQGIMKRKSLDVLKTQFCQELDQGSNGIQHTDVKISKTAQFRDTARNELGLKPSKRTPARVNEQIDQFKDALKRIGDRSDNLEYMPEDALRSLFVEVATSLPSQFRSACGNAVDSYDSSNPLLLRLSKHRERHNGQDRLEELNAQLNDLVKALDGWRYMATVKGMLIQTLSNDLEASTLETVDGQIEKAKGECKKVLERYKEGNVRPDEWKSFNDIINWFKQPMERGEDQVAEVDRDKYLKEFFKKQFMLHLIERNIDPEGMLSSIHHRMITSEVAKKYGDDAARAFAIARGKMVEEKSKKIPIENTSENFTNRYDISKNHFSINERKGNAEITVKDHKEVVPYIYNIRRFRKMLEVLYADKDEDNDIKIEGVNSLPHSEITYNLLAIKKFFNFKRIVHRWVANQDTRYTYKLFNQKRDPNGHKFKKGDDGYYAMLGTQNALGTVFLLEQYKREFNRKEITEIKWKGVDLHLFIGKKV